jgi:glycosyltransferase involved in cell wall biosynthesis
MAAGKPIIGAIDGEAQRVINESQCGFCANAEDVDGLAECVRRFVSADRSQLGEASREYYDCNYTKDKFINALEQALLDAAGASVGLDHSTRIEAKEI